MKNIKFRNKNSPTNVFFKPTSISRLENMHKINIFFIFKLIICQHKIIISPNIFSHLKKKLHKIF